VKLCVVEVDGDTDEGDGDGRWWIVWMRRVGRMDWIEEIALRGPGRRGSDAIAIV
jgi:hypothetical protein